MATTKKAKPSRQELERKIAELEAQLVHRLAFGIKTIHKAGSDHLKGSGVVLSLTLLGGKEVMEPVMIRDGLSPETIAALKADIVRSFEVATLFKP